MSCYNQRTLPRYIVWYTRKTKQSRTRKKKKKTQKVLHILCRAPIIHLNTLPLPSPSLPPLRRPHPPFQPPTHPLPLEPTPPLPRKRTASSSYTCQRALRTPSSRTRQVSPCPSSPRRSAPSPWTDAVGTAYARGPCQSVVDNRYRTALYDGKRCERRRR